MGHDKHDRDYQRMMLVVTREKCDELHMQSAALRQRAAAAVTMSRRLRAHCGWIHRDLERVYRRTG